MSIRLRVILLIAFTNLFIILLSIFTGIQFVSRNIEEAQEADMQVVADIADDYISNEIELLFLKVSDTAKNLAMTAETQWAQVLSQMQGVYPEFIGAAVFDPVQGRIASAGLAPAPADALETTHISDALEGKRTLASTYFYESSEEVVFYIAVPLPAAHDAVQAHHDGRLLAVTLSGTYFREKLIDFQIWETGHVFMLDRQGYFVSNPREHWVRERWNAFELAEDDEGFEAFGVTASLMAQGNDGIGYYSIYDVLRVCAYKPVSGSQDGWSLGTVAPLPESPFRNVNRVLLIVGILGSSLGLVAAVIASGFIKKPFEKVKALQEEAEQNSKYKSQFLANMSHEMRTPLTSVIGFTELTLRTSKLDETTRGNLVKVYSAGETLLGLINDILDISKIEANKFELNPGEYDLPSVLNDTITQSLLYLGEKPVKLVLDITEDLPRRLYGDELRVKQILNNLLSNAFKYTKKGTVELYVHCEDDGDFVWLTARVTDTGIGIKQEDFDKLFTLYASMDKENKTQDTSRRIEGTGLGLSICKRMSEMMDGEITVESEYGKGSVFTATLRQKRVNAQTIGSDVVESLKKFHYSIDKFKKDEKTRINLSYASVLVVDDNTANLDVAKGLMNLYNLKVDCVTGGRQAIDIIREEKTRYSAIFMDHMMPDIDGIETTKLIRELGTQYAREIPIIALTANAVIGNEEMFISKGFQAFLAKPIDMGELDAVLRKWVRDKSREAAEIQKQPKAFTDFDIPGIDADRLNSRYQGEIGICLTALRSFAENAAVLVEKLRDPTADTLADYCIDVHGLKSISANICADEISGKAAMLEERSKSGNIDGIPEENKTLLEETTKLANRLNTWLTKYQSASERPVRTYPDTEILEHLRKCCENFDVEGADKAMEELDGADYESETDRELIAWLKQKLTDSKFKEIAVRLNERNKCEK